MIITAPFWLLVYYFVDFFCSYFFSCIFIVALFNTPKIFWIILKDPEQAWSLQFPIFCRPCNFGTIVIRKISRMRPIFGIYLFSLVLTIINKKNTLENTEETWRAWCFFGIRLAQCGLALSYCKITPFLLTIASHFSIIVLFTRSTCSQ